jgi:hypothetical protein
VGIYKSHTETHECKGIGNVAAQFLFWNYLFQTLFFVSLQCRICSLVGYSSHPMRKIYVEILNGLWNG